MSNTIDLCATRAGPFTGITSGERAIGLFIAFLLISLILTSATYGFVNKYAGFATWNTPSLVPSNDSLSATDDPPPPYSMASPSMPTGKKEPEGASEETEGNDVSVQRRVAAFTVGSIILGLNIAALVLAVFSIQSLKYCAIEDPRDPPGIFGRMANTMWFLYAVIAMAGWCSVLWWAVLLRDLFGITTKRRWPIHSDLGAYSLMIIVISPFTLVRILLSGVMRGLSIAWKGPPERKKLIQREASDTKGNYTQVGNEGAEVTQPKMVTPPLSSPGLSGISPDIARLENARGHADCEEGSRSADGRNTAPVTAREHLRLALSTITGNREYIFTQVIPLSVANRWHELLRKRLGLSAFWGRVACYWILHLLALIIMRRILLIIYRLFPSLRRNNSDHQPLNDPVPVLVPHGRMVTILGANIVFSILELFFARLSLSYARKHPTAESQEPWTKDSSGDGIPYFGTCVAVLSLATYGGLLISKHYPRLSHLHDLFIIYTGLLCVSWPLLATLMVGEARYFLPYGGGLLDGGGGGSGDRDAYWYGMFSACAAVMAACAFVSTVKYILVFVFPKRDRAHPTG